MRSYTPAHLINTKRLVTLYRAGKTYAEIAKIENCSITTVSSRIRGAGLQPRPPGHRMQQFRSALAHLQAKT